MPHIKRQLWNFTLVELMVAMAILVIMMGFLFQFVNGARRIWTASTASAEAFDDAQIALQAIENDLKNIIQHSSDYYQTRTLPLRHIAPSGSSTDEYLFFVIGPQGSDSEPAIILYTYQSGSLYRQKISPAKLTNLYRSEIVSSPSASAPMWFDIFYYLTDTDMKEFFKISDANLVCDDIQSFNISPYTSGSNYFYAIKFSLSLKLEDLSKAGTTGSSVREFSKFVLLM